MYSPLAGGETQPSIQELVPEVQDWKLESRQEFGHEKVQLADAAKLLDAETLIRRPEFATEFAKLVNDTDFDLLSIRIQKRILYAVKIGKMTGLGLEESQSTAEKFVTIEGRLRREIVTGFLYGPIEMPVTFDGVTLPVKVDRPDNTGLFSFGH